jgi:hypothetical protein
MKKFVDVLLAVILLAALGYLIYAANTGGDAPPPASMTSTLTATLLPISNSTPSQVVTFTLVPASVTIPTRTITPKPTLTKTPTLTPTATATPTASATPTRIPTQSSLEQEIANGIERGNQIVKAIEAYHAAQGQYPPDLDMLVPAYISGIPLTVNNRPYFYRLFDGTGPLAAEVYWLSVRAESRDHVTCTYMRRLDYWDCNFASP